MSSATSVKKGLENAGSAFTIFRGDGDISGEYLSAEPNAQVTKPFIREYFIEALLSYDTQLIPGDVLEMDETGDRFLAMNKTPSMVKNAIILNDGVLYKSNVSGELLRPSGENVWDTSYRKRTSWETLSGETGSTCYGLQTEPLHGVEIDDSELGQLDIQNHELYIPASFKVKPLDRYQTASGEYFLINSVKERRYPAVDVALLEEDTRE